MVVGLCGWHSPVFIGYVVAGSAIRGSDVIQPCVELDAFVRMVFRSIDASLHPSLDFLFRKVF